MLKVKVVGYEQAKYILDELTNDMQKKMLLSALRSSAKPMLKSAQTKVPVKSGKLKKQLKIVRFRDRYAPKSEVSVAVKPVFERTKKKGAINQYYGRFIHDGTENRKSPKGRFLMFENERGEKIFTKSVKGIKATPYLANAYRETSENTVSMFGNELAVSVGKFINKNFKPIIG